MRTLLAITLAFLATGCLGFDADDESDPKSECVTCDGRADRFGFSEDPYLAAGMLEVVNTVSVETLDDDIRLYSTAAKNIVAARPFETLEELDAVPYVGLVSFGRIAEYAEARGFVGFCGDGVVQAVEECDAVEACSAQCEAVERLDITFGSIEVDGRLAGGERRAYTIPAESGDTVVVRLRSLGDAAWEPRLELFRDGRRLVYSHPETGDARIPWRPEEVDRGFELFDTADYTLVVENGAEHTGEFSLSIRCVAGGCADMAAEPQQDTDADGVFDADDNCPFTPNTDQLDADGNTTGDACQNVGGLDRFPGLSGSELADAIQAENGWVTTAGYSAAREHMFTEVDQVDGEVTCVYTGWMMRTWGVPDHTVMNTEHLWPRSKGGPESDLHHLRPTRSDANSLRSSFPFGEVSVEEWAEGGSALGTNGAGEVVFEPQHSIKGDIARALFYVAIQYDRDIEPGEERVLRAWHELDPPDSAERRRHQRIVNFQDSRNLFVDQPDLVQRIDDF